MKFKQFMYEEKLEKAHERQYTKIAKEVNYKERYKELFGNEDRIYLKLPSVSVDVTSNFSGSGVGDIIDGIIDSMTTELTKRFWDVKNGILPDIDYRTDYKKQIVTFIIGGEDNKKVPYWKKIGLENDKIKMSFDEIIKNAKGSWFGKNKERRKLDMGRVKSIPSTGTHKDLTVVISRNPCDIASMSTGRHWKSCMNLYTGGYKHHVAEDVRYGTLVAYLIDSKDTEIEKPLGRRLIKPYFSGNNVILKLTERDYGVPFPKEAKNVVEKWLKDNQKKAEKGYYAFHHELYPDDRVSGFYVGKKPVYEIGDKVKMTDVGKRRHNTKQTIHDAIGTIVTKVRDNDEKDYLYGVKYKGFYGGYRLDGKLKTPSGVHLFTPEIEKVNKK